MDMFRGSPTPETSPANIAARGASPLSRMAMPGMYAANGQQGTQQGLKEQRGSHEDLLGLAHLEPKDSGLWMFMVDIW